jgi:hypothetical protein
MPQFVDIYLVLNPHHMGYGIIAISLKPVDIRISLRYSSIMNVNILASFSAIKLKPLPIN